MRWLEGLTGRREPRRDLRGEACAAVQAEDCVMAMALWKLLARPGVASAQNNIGARFSEGAGGERKAAFAAEGGDPAGQRYLAAPFLGPARAALSREGIAKAEGRAQRILPDPAR